MTTWYFDSVNGSDSYNGTSSSTPKASYYAFNMGSSVPGDIFLFKRGTTQTFADYKPVRSGIHAAFKSKYAAYGEAQVPYCIFQNPTGTSKIILNGAQSKYIDFEDICFEMAGSAVLHSVYCASQGSGQTIGNTFRRCYFHGANNGSSDGGNGLNIAREAGATAAGPQDYLVEDCNFWGNAGHGLLIVAGRNVAVRRCNFWGNGFDDPTGGHGFSSRALHTVAPSGWTNTSGTIWQRILAAPATDAYYVRTNVSPYHLIRTAGTATAPGVGEYGVSGGVLYINVGSAANPSTQSVTYVYALCSFLTVEDCNSWGNFSDPRTPGTEGHGFAFDDYADNSVFRRNKSYDNEGFGFSINRGESNTVASNIAFNNGGPGIFVNIGYTPSIINNTLTGNNRGTVHARAAEIIFGYGCKNGVVMNNLLIGSKPYGIDNDPSNPGFSSASNNVFGFAKPDRTGFAEGTVTVDPMLDAEFRPQATALKRAGANLVGKDFYGKQFYDPPNIGAVDDLTSTPRYALKNRKP